MGAVTKVVVGTVVIGVGVGVAVRHLNLDPGCSPMPLLYPVPPGASRLALEVDGKGLAVVRHAVAEKIISALGGYDLVVVLEPDGFGGEVAANLPTDIVGAFRLKMKDAATKGAPSAAMLLALAAKGGSDVLINVRVASLPAARAEPSSARWIAADVLVVPQGTNPGHLRSVSRHTISQPGSGWEFLGMRFGAGNGMPIDQQFALLIHGNPPPLALPPAPQV